MSRKDIPKESIERLIFYTRCLTQFNEEGKKTFSSDDIAEMMNLKPTLVRKDFSYIGQMGKRGVGYNTREVLGEIRDFVCAGGECPIVLIGTGNIGSALLNYREFLSQGFRFVAVFDSNQKSVGQEIYGLKIEDIKNLKSRVKELNVKVGVIDVPQAEVLDVFKIVKESDIEAILNFTPTCLIPHEDIKGDVKIKNIDLVSEVNRLLFYINEEVDSESYNRR